MRSRMRDSRASSECPSFVIMLACLVGIGCSSEIKLAGVSGVVTKAGQPQPAVVVQFAPEAGGRSAEAMTDESGHYVLQFSFGRSGAPPGKHAVAVMTESKLNEEGREVAGRKLIYSGEYEVRSGVNTIDIAIP